MDVGIVGGTGPAGRGLAVRLAAAGVEVTIGSRVPAKGEQAAAGLAERWAGRLVAPLAGGDNAAAVSAGLVVLATPWDSAIDTVVPLAGALAGKVVISMANAVVKEGREMRALTLPEGSVAAAVQGALARSAVAAAFHHLPAAQLEDLDSGLVADVLVCSDNAEASETTMALIERIEGLRPLDAGSLSQAGVVEAFTAVCINLNIRYRAHATLRLAGI